ncbi:USP6 N-terminal-like protein, partial [Stegodyphus mimosarum]
MVQMFSDGHEGENFNSDDDQAIIAKYDAGRSETNEILSWEDPALEVYHVTDRYGFIHDHRLPEKLTAHETKIRERENERLGKWLKMIKNWDKYKDTEKLRQRVYKGVPNAVRGEVWCRLLGVPQIKLEQEGKYQEMVQQSRLYCTDIKQIDLDVNRTFRNNIMFRERYGPKQQSLFQVLAAYSIYNAEVGYCQGMSQIAGLLLMFMSDEDTFWALSVLMTDSKHAMHGFFIPGFPKLKRFQEHHDKLLTKFLPKLKKHMDKFGIHSSLYTLKWFFQCFLDRVPFTLTLRLWDAYILDGEVILTAMSFTLLKLHRKTLLKMDMDTLIEFLQIKLEQDFGYYDDVAIEALQTTILDLQKHKLHLPGQAPPNELPQKPFGLIIRPESSNGRRNLSNGGDSNTSNDSYATIERTARDNFSNKHIVNSKESRGYSKSFQKQISKSETSVNDHSTASELSSPSSISAGFPLHRTVSIYDNVDLEESVQAAYKQSPPVSRMNSPDA